MKIETMNGQWLDATLEEYKSLRTESLESMKNQQSVLRVGVGALGVLIATGFNVWEQEFLTEIVFLLFTPAIAYLSLIIWMGEVKRMMRAGSFLANREKEISKRLSDDSSCNALSWENWLREAPGSGQGQTPQMLINYLSIIGLFLLIAIGALAVGNWRIWGWEPSLWWWLVNAVEALAFAVVFGFVLSEGLKFRKR